MNNYILPGVYIEAGLQEKQRSLNSFTALFLSFEINEEEIDSNNKVIYLQSVSAMKKIHLFKEDMFISKAIRIFFENGGTSLCILPQASEKSFFLNTKKYKSFLEKHIDSLVDVESIVLIDIFTSKKFSFTHEQRQDIQNIVSEYCNSTNRLSVMDLPFDDSPSSYAKMLYHTMVFYPWVMDKNEIEMFPPSLYASAILSKLSHEKKLFHSLANIKLRSVVDTQFIVDSNFAAKLYAESINPIVYIKNDGYKIWGIRTLRDDIPDINTLRIYFFIKRVLYIITKEYVFEPNDRILRERIVRKVQDFLFSSWKEGTLKGSSEQEAFIISVDEKLDELTIEIAVSIAKPLEYIYIHLNRTTGSDLQSTLNIS